MFINPPRTFCCNTSGKGVGPAFCFKCDPVFEAVQYLNTVGVLVFVLCNHPWLKRFELVRLRSREKRSLAFEDECIW